MILERFRLMSEGFGGIKEVLLLEEVVILKNDLLKQEINLHTVKELIKQ